jgi:competence protein ComEC
LRIGACKQLCGLCVGLSKNNSLQLRGAGIRIARDAKPTYNLRAFILSFVAGVFWQQHQAELADISAWPFVFVLFAVGWAASRQRRKFLSLPGFAVAVVCAAALGTAWAAWLASARLAHALPTAWEGRDIALVGVVAKLPTTTDRGIRFEFDIERVVTPEAIVPPHISLTWYREQGRKPEADQPLPQLEPGQRWELTVRLRKPHGSANPHGFDYEAWALERNIRASGYVRVKEANTKLPEQADGLGYRVEAWRFAIRQRFQQVLGDAPYRGVLVALAIGDQNAIPQSQWKIFWRTGVGHLVSISGLHITMVASLIYALAFFVWARLPGLAVRLPAQKAAAVAGLIAALGYSLIAGFSIPTQRTLYMIAAISIALFAGRFSAPSRVLCWALLVVVLADPWAVLAPGFWLSFGAIALIFYVTAQRTGRVGVLRGAAITQVAVTLGLLPLLMVLFQEVSLVSPVANALAIPLVSLIVVPVTLIAAIVPWDGLLHLAHWLMSICMIPLEWLAATPGAMWESHAPPLWTAALALAGCLLLMAPRGWPGRWIGAIWLVPMFWVMPRAPGNGEAWVTVLDVGHGLATVVRTAQHALVYDTGPTWSEESDAGGRIVVPHLRGEGIKNLDGLIVSHDDDDHSGGAVSILNARDVEELLSSLPAESEIVAQAKTHKRCESGAAWEWDGVRFEILQPIADAYLLVNAENPKQRIKDNDMSCVLRVTAGGISMLLTGDVEKRAEAAMLATAGDRLRSDVLIVPHHGSKTSSTQPFLDAVAPKIAVLPVGYRNRFRHPHQDVMARYEAASIKILRTDMSGAITVRLSERGIETEIQRNARRRYWEAGLRTGEALE